MKLVLPVLKFPEGAVILLDVIAATICSTVSWCDRSKSGFTLISTVLGLPPNGGGDNSPGTAVKVARTCMFAIS